MFQPFRYDSVYPSSYPFAPVSPPAHRVRLYAIAPYLSSPSHNLSQTCRVDLGCLSQTWPMICCLTCQGTMYTFAIHPYCHMQICLGTICMVSGSPALLIQHHLSKQQLCNSSTWSELCLLLQRCFVWLIALLFPFFDTINALQGSIGYSFTAFVFPAGFYFWVHRTPQARANAPKQPR